MRPRLQRAFEKAVTVMATKCAHLCVACERAPVCMCVCVRVQGVCGRQVCTVCTLPCVCAVCAHLCMVCERVPVYVCKVCVCGVCECTQCVCAYLCVHAWALCGYAYTSVWCGGGFTLL